MGEYEKHLQYPSHMHGVVNFTIMKCIEFIFSNRLRNNEGLHGFVNCESPIYSEKLNMPVGFSVVILHL